MYQPISPWTLVAYPEPIQPRPTSTPPIAIISRGPIRSTRYPSKGTSHVSAITKVAKAIWMVASEACRLLLSGLVKSVHAYCRFAIAIIATIPATSCIQRLTMRAWGLRADSMICMDHLRK